LASCILMRSTKYIYNTVPTFIRTCTHTLYILYCIKSQNIASARETKQEYHHCDKKLAHLPHQCKPIGCCADADSKSIHVRQKWRVNRASTRREWSPHSRMGVWGRGPEYGNRIGGANFLTLFYSNHESILLSFRDMTMGSTTDKRTTAVSNQCIYGP